MEQINANAQAEYERKLKESKLPLIGVAMLFFGISSVLLLVVNLYLRQQAMVQSMNLSLIGIAVLLLLAFLLYKVLTRKIDADLKDLSFKREAVVIKEILCDNDVEAGSGVLYIPILGRLFPRLWGQRMRQIKRYYFISDKNVRHEIDAKYYDKLVGKESCSFILGSTSTVMVGIEA